MGVFLCPKETTMISITDDASFDRALEQVRCAALRDLIIRRRAILGTDLPFADMAQFIVVQAGDTIDQIEADTGLVIRPDERDLWPMWEWVLDHGYCFETVFVLSDDGYAVVLFVENFGRIDAELIGMLHAFTTAN